MSEPAAIQEQQDRILCEMAELGLSFARKLEARVELVTSVEEAHALARAYDRVTRSARLSIALQSRLARDRVEIARLQRAEAARATDRRKAQIKAVLEDEIFTEDRDQDEADTLQERLTERLDREALFERFLTAPFPKALARIRNDIGLGEGEASLTSPALAAGGGPSAEERMVEGASGAQDDCGSPPPPPALRGARPAVPLPPSAMGEGRKKPDPS